MDAASLVKRIQEGVWQAFEVLVEQYREKALRTVYFITGSKDIAEETVQEAFVQCHKKSRVCVIRRLSKRGFTTS
ncbi:MAG: hypothetical protein IMX03_05380 [Brockia lithotrophica]|nr:hypothetical protein [Brockia lithotrophica]